jgi:hypothetical protein
MMKNSTYHLIGCPLWMLSLAMLLPWDSLTSTIKFVVGGVAGIYAIMFIARSQLPDEKTEKKAETLPSPGAPGS